MTKLKKIWSRLVESRVSVPGPFVVLVGITFVAIVLLLGSRMTALTNAVNDLQRRTQSLEVTLDEWAAESEAVPDDGCYDGGGEEEPVDPRFLDIGDRL